MASLNTGHDRKFDRPPGRKLRTGDAQADVARERRQVAPGPVVFTVGHSTRALDDFIALLKAHGVQRLVDVRTVPRSRHNPQFNRDTLPDALQAAGIGYTHMAALGGLRKPRPDSPNAGWRNLSFRGYADYMQSPGFASGLEEIMTAAPDEQLALMCAEAVPWRCHRSLIADALLVRGMQVEELTDAKRREPHRLTPFARVDGTTLTYPPTEDSAPQGELFPPTPGAPREKGELSPATPSTPRRRRKK